MGHNSELPIGNKDRIGQHPAGNPQTHNVQQLKRVYRRWFQNIENNNKRLRHLRDKNYIRKLIRSKRMQYRSDFVDPYGLDPIHVENWKALLSFLYRQYFKVECYGTSNIPDHERAMLVPNHGGILPYDILMLMYALKYEHSGHRTLRPLIEDELFYFPHIGTFLNRQGCVRASKENAEELLRANNLIAVFPEGAKGLLKLHKDRYRLERFGRGGFIKVASATQTPIIPTAIYGCEDVTPIRSKLPLPKTLALDYLPMSQRFFFLGPLGLIPKRVKWKIVFGKPIVIKPDMMSDSISLRDLNETIREKIQSMLDDLISLRD